MAGKKGGEQGEREVQNRSRAQAVYTDSKTCFSGVLFTLIGGLL